MNRLVNKAKSTRKNWFEAFKVTCNIHGYEYYEMPAEIRYRYPAPGSGAMDSTSYPHLFKKHWKTPFRDSQFNIRMKPKSISMEDDSIHTISTLPNLDPENPDHVDMLKEFQPKTDDLIIAHDPELGAIDSEASLQELRDEFEGRQAATQFDIESRSGYHNDLDSTYNMVQFNWRERGATGMESDPRMKQVFVEMEYWIENVIGAKQIHDKQIMFYKGTPKKWQILDDDMVGVPRETIEAMQAAVQAPLPDELEMFQEKHSVPMQLPFNEANVAKWRDEPKFSDSADFDPEFLQITRETKKKYFIERYEKPRELAAETH